MHTYEFTFKCERCAKELTEVVTSPDILAREELIQMEFHVDGAGREPARRQKR
jgi:hypothetical protein